MFRLWGKIMKDNEMVTDHVFELTNMTLSEEDKVKEGMEAICYHFDIGKPMWFSDNYNDYNLVGKTRFMEHHFIESINFDYFEIEVIENKK